ncbi:MAG: hypothetical protein MJ129_04210 [Clostridia bacterium]|nr:hypothetical protein [Clostridia bacterium]
MAKVKKEASLLKKIIKLVLAVAGLLIAAVLAVVIVYINPFNMPAIFKRNYPEWFEAHPFISSLISVD